MTNIAKSCKSVTVGSRALPCILVLIAYLLSARHDAFGETAPSWDQFLRARQSGEIGLLPDFSYAGYNFSAEPLPSTAERPQFDVTNYGAVANDNQYDDHAIQAAVDAAESAAGGVVHFPPGRYLISPDRDRDRQIRVSQSHIVLRGSGANDDGTEIHMVQRRVGSRQIVFRPERTRDAQLTEIVADAPRETFWVEVADSLSLRAGQTVIIRHASEAFTRRYFEQLPLAPEWTRLYGRRGGMKIGEVHTIAEIDGRRVRFANPLHFDLEVGVADEPFTLEAYSTIVDCGVEAIRFTGSWDSYPEAFVHHKDAIHDSGWCALGMERVADGWIRDCEFRNWNECIYLDGAYKLTIQNVAFTGKKGHTSVHVRRGYGALIKQCRFDAGHHHGPGPGYGAVGTVVTQCTMQEDQNIDSHSGQPFATLYDDVEGGVFRNLGGPHQGLPHHGKYMVFWNFRHRSTYDFHYDFWDVDRRRNHTIAQPIFVGFRANRRITFAGEGLNESPGVAVEPRSLFEAQLALRLDRSADQADGDNSEQPTDTN